jgi:hypothetical protein
VVACIADRLRRFAADELALLLPGRQEGHARSEAAGSEVTVSRGS